MDERLSLRKMCMSKCGMTGYFGWDVQEICVPLAPAGAKLNQMSLFLRGDWVQFVVWWERKSASPSVFCCLLVLFSRQPRSAATAWVRPAVLHIHHRQTSLS